MDLYYVGTLMPDPDAWNDPAAWSQSSGGSGGDGPPQGTDVAIFDANSPDCTMTADALYSFGKLKLATGFANTLSMAGYKFPSVGETEVVAGTLNTGGGDGTDLGAVTQSGGTIDMESGNIYLDSYAGSGGTLILGSTRTTIDGDADFNVATLAHSNGELVFGAAAGTQSFTTRGKSFYNVTLGGNTAVVQVGALSCYNLKVNAASGFWDTNGNNLTIGAGGLTVMAGTLGLSTGTHTVSGGYTQSGGTTNGSGCTLSVDGAFAVSAGQFNAPSGTLTLKDNFTMSGTGDFVHNNGTVKFAATSGTKTLASNGESLYNLTIDGVGQTVQLTAALTVANTFQHTNGVFDCNTYALNVNGNVNFASSLGSNAFLATSSVVTIGGNVDQNATTVISYGTSKFKFTGSGKTWTTYNGKNQDLYDLELAAGASLTWQGVTGNNYHKFCRNALTLGAGSKFKTTGGGGAIGFYFTAGDKFSVDATAEIENANSASQLLLCEWGGDFTFQWNPCILTASGAGGGFGFYTNSGAGTRNVQLMGNISVVGTYGDVRFEEVQGYYGTREVLFNGYNLSCSRDLLNAPVYRGFGLIVGGSTLTIGRDLRLDEVQGATSYELDVNAGSISIGRDVVKPVADSKTWRLRGSALVTVAGSWKCSARTATFFSGGDGTGRIRFTGAGPLTIEAGHTFASSTPPITVEIALASGTISLTAAATIDKLKVVSGTFAAVSYKLLISYGASCGIEITGGTLDLGTYTGHEIRASVSVGVLGTLTHTSGRVDFVANSSAFSTLSGIITLASAKFIKAGGTYSTVWNVEGTLTVTGDLILDAYNPGSYTMTWNTAGAGSIRVRGNINVLNNPSGFRGSCPFIIDGSSGDQTVNGGCWAMDDLRVDKTSGKWVATGNINFGGYYLPSSNVKFQTAVDFVTNLITVVLGCYGSATTKVWNGFTAYNLSLNSGGGASTGNAYIDLNGQRVICQNQCAVQLDTNSWAKQINNGFVECQGDLLFDLNDSETHTRGTAVFEMTGSVPATIGGNGTTKYFNDLKVKKDDGVAITVATADFGMRGGTLTVENGVLCLAGFALRCAVLNVNAGGELKVKGTETITTDTSRTFATGSTVRFYDAGTTAVVSNVGTSFANVALGSGKTHNFTAGATYTIAGVFSSDGNSGSRSLLRSTVDGTYWNLNLTGGSVLDSAVDVKDSFADGGNWVDAIGSVDSGHNSHWRFSAGGAGGGGILKSSMIQGVAA